MDSYLPVWAVILIVLVSIIVLFILVGVVIKHYFDKYLEKKELEAIEQKKKDEELLKFKDEQKRQERKADVIESVGMVIHPLEDKIDMLNQKLQKVEDGTLSTLRNDILTCYYKCAEKGYRNDYDYQNIHHMYESYAELHGNSYVADIMKKFDALPAKEDQEN